MASPVAFARFSDCCAALPAHRSTLRRVTVAVLSIWAVVGALVAAIVIAIVSDLRH